MNVPNIGRRRTLPLAAQKVQRGRTLSTVCEYSSKYLVDCPLIYYTLLLVFCTFGAYSSQYSGISHNGPSQERPPTNGQPL